MSQDSQLNPSSDYYASRAVEERRLAMSANNERAREIHLELADKYSELSSMGAPQPGVTEEQQRAG